MFISSLLLLRYNRKGLLAIEMNRSLKQIGLVVILSLKVTLIFSAPPFITDDPDPVEYQHWQFYLFSTLDKSDMYRQVNVPSFTLNYGALPNFEASLTFGFLSFKQNVFLEALNVLDAYGFTDMALTPKYTLIKETNTFPQIAVAPSISFPTGAQRRGLGNGRSILTYPIWLQKSWGSWTTYGGGGYLENLTPNTKNFYFEGWVIQKELSDKIMLGMEIYHQNGSLVTGRSTTLATWGGSYSFPSSKSVLFSFSRQITSEKHLMIYLGLFLEFAD
jgi:hypothetical protein